MNDPIDPELLALAAKAEERRKVLVVADTEPVPPSSWVAAVAPNAVAMFRAQQVAAEEHASTCTERPCERCERYLCDCGEPIDHRRTCSACAQRMILASHLRVTHESVPARFAWTLGVSADFLATRVRGSAELVTRALAAPPSKSLLFLGPTGSGKTSLAVAMLDAWARSSPKPGAMFLEGAWLARARARHRLGQGDPPLVTDAMTAPLLLLDDLGQEREDRDGCITDVVYERHNAQLPTWVTCGLANGDEATFGEHLSRRYDGGFVRRILETGKPIRLGAR